jgi:hypothetical protein
MDARRLLTALGSSLTVFLLVSAAIIRILDFEFSAIIALPVGGIAGFAVLLGIVVFYEKLGKTGKRVTQAVAAFGFTIFFLAGLSYVNLGGFRGALSVQLWLLVAVAVALMTYAMQWLQSRSGTRP